MTCYRCKDDKGFIDEECIFVTEPETTTEIAASSAVEITVKPLVIINNNNTNITTSESKIRNARSTKEEKDDATKDRYEELEVLDDEVDEAEPYDYVAETRPIYDKVLGITLPAYMLLRSPQEKEFDESVENSRF